MRKILIAIFVLACSCYSTEKYMVNMTESLKDAQMYLGAKYLDHIKDGLLSAAKADETSKVDQIISTIKLNAIISNNENNLFLMRDENYTDDMFLRFSDQALLNTVKNGKIFNACPWSLPSIYGHATAAIREDVFKAYLKALSWCLPKNVSDFFKDPLIETSNFMTDYESKQNLEVLKKYAVKFELDSRICTMIRDIIHPESDFEIFPNGYEVISRMQSNKIGGLVITQEATSYMIEHPYELFEDNAKAIRNFLGSYISYPEKLQIIPTFKECANICAKTELLDSILAEEIYNQFNPNTSPIEGSSDSL